MKDLCLKLAKAVSEDEVRIVMGSRTSFRAACSLATPRSPAPNPDGWPARSAVEQAFLPWRSVSASHGNLLHSQNLNKNNCLLSRYLVSKAPKLRHSPCYLWN